MFEHERHLGEQRGGESPRTSDGEIYIGGHNTPTQDEIATAEMNESLDRQATEGLRAEVKDAYAEWQADIDDYELERDYFHQLDKLDQVLASQGLERGEDIDEELPLREFQTQEDYMTSRLPWSRSEQEPTWYVLEIDNPNGPGKLYMSREGMENENAPAWDTLDKAAITDERSAQEFARRVATNQLTGLRPVRAGSSSPRGSPDRD